MTLAAMSLGDFTFHERYLEVPETVGSLGGYQIVEQHDFPGGVRTHQPFGWFPSPIEWRASFTGPLAQIRCEQVKRLSVPGNELLLRIGSKAWLGSVHVFDPRPRHQFLIPYSMVFLPRVDQAAVRGSIPGQDLSAMLGTAMSSLSGVVGGIADDLAAQVFLLLDEVSNALLLASSIVAAIASDKRSTIRMQCGVVQATAKPYTQSADPSVSAPAAFVGVQAATIANVMTAPGATKWTVRQVNPNLPAIAAQYLGSASRWTDIATLNGLTDPHPVGIYTLTIPAP